MGQFIVIGVIAGSINALIALGLITTFQTTGVLNLAFGAMMMVAAFTFATVATDLGPWGAFAVVLGGSLVAGAALGVLTLPMRSATPVVKAAASLGVITALQAVTLLLWGDLPRPVPTLTTARGVVVFDVAVSRQQLLTLVAVLVAGVGVAALLRLGKLGAGLRAMANDVQVSRLVGLPVRHLWVVSWVIVTPMAALAAILIVPSTGLGTAALTFSILPAMAAVLAAQFRHPGRGVIVAIAIGVADGVLASRPEWGSYRGALPLAIGLGALLLIPSGRTGAWERV